ncbi:MAG: hypothetical protein ACPL4N_02965 [Candidatus Norongarragalinales archaeon]
MQNKNALPNYLQSQPRPIGGGKKVRLDFSVDLELDELFKSRLLFLVVALVLLALSALMFARTGFSFNDLFDFSRVQYSLEKIASISVMLYVLLFALSLACAAYYGFGIKKWQSLLMLPVSLLVAGVFSLLFPPFWPAFTAMALATAAASFFGSFAREPTYTYASAAVSRALFVFLIAAALFTFSIVSAQKEDRFNQFVDGAIALVPQATQELSSTLSSTFLQAVNLDEETVKKIFTKEQLKPIVAEQYDLSRNTTIGLLKGFIAEDTLNSSLPVFSALPASKQDEILQQYYDSLAKQITASSQQLKQQLAAQLSANTNQTSTALSASLVKQQLLQTEQGKLAYIFFSFIVTLAVIAVVSFLNFFVRVIASFFAWALYKLQP